MENALQKSGSPSIYMRNIQICFPGLVFTLVSLFFNTKEYDMVARNGFFAGFDSTVGCMILLHAGGGMLVSFLVKTVGSLWKGFASSLAIVG